MPSFTPKQPNFYSKTGQKVNTAGLQSVQAAGRQSGTGNNSSGTPGVAKSNSVNSVNRSRNGVNAPSVSLKAAVNAAAVGAGVALVDTALNAAGVPSNLSGALYGVNRLNPTFNRLLSGGFPLGGSYVGYDDTAAGPISDFTPIAAFAESEENRVIIKDQTGLFITQGNSILKPLLATNGVIFPFTPTIGTSHKANYEVENLLHTNYGTPYYTHSSVDGINIQGRFTAQTPEEAKYIVAMMHFFKTATKMFYGATKNRGTPPPVLYLDAHGQFMYDHIPVVVREFQYSLPNDVNYMSVTIGKGITKVPVDVQVTVDLIPTYSRNKISNEFDLVKFSQGQLLTSGSGNRSGGWI